MPAFFLLPGEPCRSCSAFLSRFTLAARFLAGLDLLEFHGGEFSQQLSLCALAFRVEVTHGTGSSVFTVWRGREPLVTWNGILLDGHNRFEICTRHALKFSTVSIECEDDNAAKAWIIRNQFGRRNITLTSRCELAEKLAEALRPKAKENLSAGGGDRKSSQGKSGSPILANPIDTREQAAKEAGISHGSLAVYRYLKANAEPEELEELKLNPEAKLHKVVKAVRERKAKENRQMKRHEDVGWLGDFERCLAWAILERASSPPHA